MQYALHIGHLMLLCVQSYTYTGVPTAVSDLEQEVSPS